MSFSENFTDMYWSDNYELFALVAQGQEPYRWDLMSFENSQLQILAQVSRVPPLVNCNETAQYQSGAVYHIGIPSPDCCMISGCGAPCYEYELWQRNMRKRVERLMYG